MIFKSNKQKVETLSRNLKKSFKESNIDCNIAIVNNYQCIQVTNNDELFFWIRLSADKDGMLVVDFNNVVLPEECRGKHIFSLIVSRVLRCKYVSRVKITSICTERMKNWCELHKMIKCGYNDYYLDA